MKSSCSRYLGAVLALLALGALCPAQTPPAGFTDELVISSVPTPVGIAFTPDGRLFVCSLVSYGLYCAKTDGTTQLTGVVPGGIVGAESGLLGIAVDPAWPVKPYVYVHYSRTDGMTVSRFTMTGPVGDPTSVNLTLGARHDVVAGLPDNVTNHNGGTVRFGGDGMLYASFGDDVTPCAAQVIGNGQGEILRMDVSGLPPGAGGPPPPASIAPPGNPYSTGGPWAPLVWAYGLRNPFRFTIDCSGPAASQTMYIADVGSSSWEELDEAPFATPGLNFGWPFFEGNAPFGTCGPQPAGLVAPIATLSATQGAHSIMAMPRYRNLAGAPFAFGPAYEGDLFFVDHFEGVIRRLQSGPGGWTLAAPVAGQPAAGWGVGYFGFMDAVLGPDGAVYYVRPSEVRRIKADPTQPNLLKVSGDLQSGVQGRELTAALKVRVLDPFGAPLTGVPVTFTPNRGSVGTQPVLSDGGGFANTRFTLDPLDPTPPVITAAVPGGSTVSFTATWRGLVVGHFPQIGVALVDVRTHDAGVPVSLALDVPRAAPVLSLQFFGDIWVDFLTPSPALTVLVDGLGLFGPPALGVQTQGSPGVWSIVYTGLPSLGGATFTLQAFAVDPSLFPSTSAVMLGGRVDITL